ncbi:MAG: hypothetical protein ACRC6U_04030 [Fusobacteriaceae bacterium]
MIIFLLVIIVLIMLVNSFSSSCKDISKGMNSATKAMSEASDLAFLVK